MMNFPVDQPFPHPLFEACDNQNLRQVKRLLKEKVDASSKRFALRRCARRGNIPIAKELMKHDAKLSDSLVMTNAIENGHLKFVTFLVENGVDFHVYDEDALTLAIKRGHESIVKYLLSIGANVNIFDGYLLILACSKQASGKLSIVKLLLSHGIKVQEPRFEELRVAIEAKNFDIARYLLKHGANGKDNFSLSICAENGYLELVKLLVKHGANPEENHYMAVRKAAEANQLEVVKFLLSKCGNINSILSCEQQSSKHTFTYLLENGASFRAFF